MSKNLGIYAQEEYEENMNELRGVSDYGEDEGFRPERLAEDTEVENTIIETQDRLAEVEEGETNIELADQGIRSLESLTVTVEMLQANGGMNAQTAILYNHAYDSILRSNFGAKPSVEEYLSLEGFKSPSSRETSTTLALEDLKTKAKEIYKKAIEAIKKLIEQIKNAVKTFFSATEAVKKRADKMKTRINKLAEKNSYTLVAKNEKKGLYSESNLETWAMRISKCSGVGEPLKPQSVALSIDDCKLFLKDLKEGSFLKDINENVQRMTKWAEDVIGDVKKNKGTVNSKSLIERGVSTAIKFFGRETQSDKIRKIFDRGESGKYYHTTRFMPGGYALLGFMGHGGSGEDKSSFVLPSVALRYAKVASENKPKLKDGDIPTSLETMANLCDHVKNTMVIQKSAQEAVEKTLNSIKENLDKLRSKLTDADDTVQGGSISGQFSTFKNKLFSYFKSLVTSLGSPINRAFAHSITLNKLYLSIFGTVIGNAKLEKPAKD